MSAPTSWHDRLDGSIDPAWADEIDEFENQLRLRKQGRLDEAVFAETRLRRGAYGQRYDNGRRHDGYATREQPLDTSVPTTTHALDVTTLRQAQTVRRRVLAQEARVLRAFHPDPNSMLDPRRRPPVPSVAQVQPEEPRGLRQAAHDVVAEEDR